MFSQCCQLCTLVRFLKKGEIVPNVPQCGKFQDFSVTQILREINFREFRRPKPAFFAILGALNFVNIVNISLQKVQSKNSQPLNVQKWQILHF